MHFDTGTQQRCFHAARLLPERFVTVLNGQLIFALATINLRANEEGWPQLRIDSKCRINVSLAPSISPFLS